MTLKTKEYKFNDQFVKIILLGNKALLGLKPAVFAKEFFECYQGIMEDTFKITLDASTARTSLRFAFVRARKTNDTKNN